MRIVVTGGAGFIGSHLSERLLGLGHHVVCIDNFSDYYDPGLKRQNLESVRSCRAFQLIEGDIHDGAILDSLRLGRDDALVHLAALAGVRRSIEDPSAYERVNVQGTIRLLEQSRRRKLGRFIFASSSSVYGPTAAIPFRESDDKLHPASPYGASKLAAEHFCRIFHHLHGLPVTCLRLFTVYGPRQRPDMAIRRFVQQVDEGTPIVVYGDGTTKRDYTYVDDVVDGIVRALDRAEGFRVYNLGTHQTVALRDLIAIIEGALNKRALVTYQPTQPGDLSATQASIELAARDLGYAPTVEIEEGVKRFVQWFRRAG